CQTGEVALPGGACAREALPGLEETVRTRLPHLAPGAASRLVGLYGSDCEALLARVAAEPGAGEPLPGQADVPRAEVERAIDEEMALTLEDILERRTRLLL